MIGLLGGTFNPVHSGHLSIAKEVLHSCALSAVHFLPCHTPVHRHAPLVTPQQRIAMLQLALQDEEQLQLNLSEIERGGASYMIDTLKYLTQQLSEAIVLILGTDAFNKLHTWKHAEQILNYCHIVVCQRPNERCSQTRFKPNHIDDIQLLQQKPNGGVYFLAVKPVPCSATFIRKNSANSDAIARYLPQPVLEFIQSNHLYESNKI